MNATLKRYDGMSVTLLRRFYQDWMSLMYQSMVSLRRSSRKALLYRRSMGVNPYDFSRTGVQKTYWEYNKPRFL